MDNKNEIKQLGVASILAYHLLPGIPILLITIILTNPIWGLGLPVFLSLMMAILFGLIPTQLGILAVHAKKQGKKIKEIINFREKMPLSKLLLWSITLLCFSGVIFMLVSNFEHSLWTIFDWIPDWFRIGRFSTDTSSKFIILLTLILGFIFNGILGPLVEEFYFRGFLLPRMQKLGKWAPFVNSVLFSLYHFFTPWENITRIIAITPFVYAVWYKKNIYIGIIVHLSLNTISMIMMAISIL